jgi:peptidoglycan hydrolase-like protein with peptidoglycan-binding domain
MVSPPRTPIRLTVSALGVALGLAAVGPVVASADTTTTTSTTTTTTTTTTVPVTTTTVRKVRPVIKVHEGPTLVAGDQGPSVLWLQRRLAVLGYWIGGASGYFGDSTQQAVFAFQKAANLPLDGVVGPATYRALAHGIQPKPRSTSGRVVEVNLRKDLLMIVDNGQVKAVLNTSTGGGYTYTSDGVTAVAITPVGHFHILRAVNGLVVDSLGALWRPRYFDDGFAIHGDSYVPQVPVSHGCVRVSNEAIDWIWATNQLPLGMSVWIYG